VRSSSSSLANVVIDAAANGFFAHQPRSLGMGVLGEGSLAPEGPRGSTVRGIAGASGAEGSAVWRGAGATEAVDLVSIAAPRLLGRLTGAGRQLEELTTTDV
jgi:hypothetical protein